MTEPVLREPASGGPQPPAPLWLQVAGVVVACAGGLLVGLVGAFFTPFRIGAVLIPISLVIAVVGLTAVTHFAYAVTGRVGLSLGPGLVWLAVSLVLAGRTTEGDLVLTQQWVPTVYLIVGSVTIGVVAFRLIVPPRR